MLVGLFEGNKMRGVITLALSAGSLLERKSCAFLSLAQAHQHHECFVDYKLSRKAFSRYEPRTKTTGT